MISAALPVQAAADERLHCVNIGYYEPAFEDHERMLRQLGRDSAAYRDLQYSFLDLGDHKLTYAGLLNYVLQGGGKALAAGQELADVVKSGDIPNLAAVYLTNFLRRQGLQAEYVNLFLYEQERLRDLLDRKPLVVGITTTFYSLNFPVIEIVRAIRQINSECTIVVGGPLVANHGRRYEGEELFIALEDLGADVYVIESQGELTLWRIVEELRNGGDLSRVPNIVYRDSTGRLSATAKEPEQNSLNENAIDWSLFSGENLGATLQTRTARSCAFSCAFCGYPTRAGKLTLANLDTIEWELDAMHAVGGVENVVFIDDTFNVPLPRFKDICRLMIRKQYGFNWFSYFRCSNSDEEAFELMARSGCKGVFLGIESGSPRILENMDKHATVEKYRDGARLLKRYGILTFGSFITGFPGETAETVRETIDFIEAADLDYYRAQVWYCEPGTPIYNRKERYGIEGEGYNWRHNTMDNAQAMEHIDDIFFAVKGSAWLPQWSFDFWILPYLLGKGLPLDRVKRFVAEAQKMLSLEMLDFEDNPEEKRALQRRHLAELNRTLGGWRPV